MSSSLEEYQIQSMTFSIKSSTNKDDVDIENQSQTDVSQVSVETEVKTSTSSKADEEVSINDDVYNMFFLSNIGGQAFYYALYIFVLKLTLYTVLAMDTWVTEGPEVMDNKVLIAQFLMIPVAVAMQDDLMTTFFLIGNIKFSPALQEQNPDASNLKFHIANFGRGFDGLYSLFINFIILLKAQSVQALFLNFAALQFLQTIDNIALDLASNGYLTECLERVADNVKNAKLPRKSNPWFLVMDTVFFVTAFLILVVIWVYVNFVA